MLWKSFIVFVLALCWFTAAQAVAQVVDPHRVYEERCSACHGAHAVDFARRGLQLRDGNLVGKRSGKELTIILRQHAGTQQSDAEITALVELLTRNISSGLLYQRKCIVCHDRARDFARLNLRLVEGVLRGRYTNRETEDFLKSHGRLTDAEIAHMVATLKWQLETREP